MLKMSLYVGIGVIVNAINPGKKVSGTKKEKFMASLKHFGINFGVSIGLRMVYMQLTGMTLNMTLTALLAIIQLAVTFVLGRIHKKAAEFIKTHSIEGQIETADELVNIRRDELKDAETALKEAQAALKAAQAALDEAEGHKAILETKLNQKVERRNVRLARLHKAVRIGQSVTGRIAYIIRREYGVARKTVTLVLALIVTVAVVLITTAQSIPYIYGLR